MFLELQHTDIGYKHPLIKEACAKLNLGETTLLIGNNGVGKTTLLKSILKQHPILKGRITLHQKPLSDYSPVQMASQIAVVFSKSDYSPYLTVEDLVALGKYIHYPYYFSLKTSDRRQVEEIIENLGLSPYRHYPLGKLSDGNLQKAFIGRAVAQNTPMILLDEPTTHLDEENKIAILQLLRQLAKTQNKAILFSSHDWRLAKAFSDKLWLVKDRKLYTGIVEDVLKTHCLLNDLRLLPELPSESLPFISAPTSEAELLTSLLIKQNREVSAFSFVYHDDAWTVSKGDWQKKVFSFEELLSILPS
ncbi:ABC transporter ATP-binding protein [Bergeyella sp. RCAD1439]|uniref:ABC transporter ATP-binding protein n=1 Tax=Bergeyella anatis TaxID=3113737 RepID=UPI002E16B84B|nr:ABC transporter ATP-binding protein [Bergeyella sp. RCAD1439]